MVLTEVLALELKQSETGMFEKYKNTIDKYIREPYLREPLFALYRKTESRLNHPKLASDAMLKKLNGSSIQSVMDSIFAINKGKVIYMDCWATWCGPCLDEMPNSKKLMEDMEGKDVAFVFMCVDSNEKQWKAILSKFALGGQHLLLNKEQSHDLRQVFKINGIPHYILFDKNGNIVESVTGRPAEVKDIDKLLN